MSKEKIWTWFVNLSALFGLAGPIFLVAWYFYALDSRVTILESQMKAFVISPAGVRFSDDRLPAVNMPNPLAATCAELMQRAAKAVEAGSPMTVAEPIQKMADSFGCRNLLAKQ